MRVAVALFDTRVPEVGRESPLTRLHMALCHKRGDAVLATRTLVCPERL